MKIRLSPQKIKQNLSNPLFPIWIGAFLDIFLMSILSTYLPRILLDLNVRVVHIGLLLSINIFVGFFSGIFWGKMSDKYGRKPILIICRLGTLFGYLILAFSGNILMIIISRIIDGIFSRNTQVVLTIIGDIVPEEKRSSEMSKAGAAWIVGGLVGPGIGALLYTFGILGFGLFNAAVAALALLIPILTLKESNPNINGIGEIHQRKPLFSTKILKQRNPRLLLSQSLFNTLSHFIFRTTITIFITTRFGFSIIQIGELLTLIGVINLLVRLLIFPRILRKFGDEKTMLIGYATFLIAFLWLIFLEDIVSYVMVSILVSLATTCSMDLMNGVMSKVVEKKELGEMIGLNAAAESVSLIIGPILGSYLISVSNNAFYGLTAAVVSLIPLVIGLLRRSNKPLQTKQSEERLASTK